MIRLLLQVSALLLLANLLVVMVPDKANYAPHVYSAKTEFNPHFLRLNKEIDEKYYAQPAFAQELPGDGAAGEAGKQCYRVGPFMHRANFELAQAVLLNANVDYRKTKRESKESNVYRVYLGPYSSSAEVADVRAMLKRSNVLDHFVRREADDVFVVSLGIFTTQESALSAVKLFKGKLNNVRMKDEQVVLPDSYWLHFSVDDGGQLKSQLAQMDWGEQSAIMGKHQCL